MLKVFRATGYILVLVIAIVNWSDRCQAASDTTDLSSDGAQAKVSGWCNFGLESDNTNGECKCDGTSPAEELKPDEDKTARILSQKKDASGKVIQVTIRTDANLALFGHVSSLTHYFRSLEACQDSRAKAEAALKKRANRRNAQVDKALAPYR